MEIEVRKSETAMQERFLQADAQQWLDLFEIEDIAGGLVQNIDEAANDPQILNNEMILSLQHQLGGLVKLVGNPIKMSGVNQDDYNAPSLLGQHTEEVFKELLGYPEKKIHNIKKEAAAHTKELSSHLHKTL